MTGFLSPRPRWQRAVSALVAVLVALVARAVVAHLPETGVVVALNAFQMVDWVVMKSLDRLLNKLSVAANFNTDYNKEFKKEFAVNDTVRVKLPQRFLIRDGFTYSPQPLQRVYTTVQVNQPFGIDFEWDSFDDALKMERGEAALEREYIDPAMDQIAQEIDSRAALWAYQHSNNIVGQLGTDPVDFDSISAAARQRLVENGCPPNGDKIMVVTPAVMKSLKKSQLTFNRPSPTLDKAYRTGIVGDADSFDWYESMSIYSHTAGTIAGTVTVNGAGQSGSSLLITATAGDTFNVGDVFGIQSVFPVNPSTRRRTQSATTKQVRVTAPLVALGGGVDLLNIAPALFGPGSQYQNIDALPGNAAVLTLMPGTTSPNAKSGSQNLAFHRDAFALVGVDLAMPKTSSVEVAKKLRDPETGITISLIRDFDSKERKWITRFDILLGFGDLYPDNCSVRGLGA